jgi:hypothetical protein
VPGTRVEADPMLAVSRALGRTLQQGDVRLADDAGVAGRETVQKLIRSASVVDLGKLADPSVDLESLAG